MHEERYTKDEFSENAKQRGLASFTELGEKLFQWRDYTPIPLIILVLLTADPSVSTATVGTLICILGELFRIYAVSFIGTISRTRNKSTTGGELIVRGPFSWVRNPLYVGNFFIVLGLAIFGGVAWVVAVTVLLFGFQYYAIVKHEEKLLVERFGREYELYRETVPAWIPSRIPSLDNWEWPDTFSPALRSERRTLTAILVMMLALVLLA